MDTNELKITALSNLFDTNPSNIVMISNNKYRIGRRTYHVYTLHQKLEYENNNDIKLPYNLIIDLNYEQLYVKIDRFH